MEIKTENFCPRCGSPKMKSWDELTEDQKFLIEKLPLSVDFTLEGRKRHRFCERCLFEMPEKENQTV